MRVSSWAITTCLSLIATAATAQAPDAGGAPVPPPGCGTVTPQGECAGNVVRYCDDSVTPNELIEFDCVADLDPGAVCQTISPAYGVDCAMPTGGECVFADENGDLFQLFCQGTGNVCVETISGSMCGANQGTCTEAEVETCRGDQAVIQCFEGQAWLLDCATFDGTCSAGICVDIPEGGACGDGIECAAGLVCNDEFTCEAAGGSPDAGSGGRDGGGGGTGDGGGGGRDGGSSGNDDAATTTNPDATAAAPDAGTSGSADAATLPRADASAGGGGGGAVTRDEGGCSSMSGTGSGLVTSLLVVGGLIGLIARRRRD